MSSSNDNTDETLEQTGQGEPLEQEAGTQTEAGHVNAEESREAAAEEGQGAQPEEPEEATESEEPEEAEDPVAALQDEIQQLKDTLLRERADFINFRKRSTAEREAAQTRATEDILQKLIPALDSFDQLLTVKIEDEGSAGKQVVEGASLIRKMMWQVFTDLGVSELDPIGGAFNPTQMEALSVSESDRVTEERVEQVYQKAYIINDKVIRPARVAVVKPAPPAENVSSEETETNKN